MRGTLLAERMKQYEAVTDLSLTRRVPAIIRVDGKGFHTVLRHADKPFDAGVMNGMDSAAVATIDGMQNAKMAYVQSDEVSFLLCDYDSIETDAWFGYRAQKLNSVAASTMTAQFTEHYRIPRLMRSFVCSISVFDGRVFNVPEAEVSNYFLWRARDWKRNSLQMYARSVFSAKQLHKKCADDLHQMLHGLGKNWATDLSDREKNGAWIIPGDDGKWVRRSDIHAKYSEVAALVDSVLPEDK